MTASDSGYLVVQTEIVRSPRRGDTSQVRPLYRGIDRVPAYPSEHSQEAAALDFYVFGACKDSRTNLIPSLDTARRLRDWLSTGGRQFEVLLCCEDSRCPLVLQLPVLERVPLGFDVAGIKGDYWSIVADFSQSAWAKPFFTRLNQNGLFDRRMDAEEYLQGYIRHGEPDPEGQEVVYVVQVRDEPGSPINRGP